MGPNDKSRNVGSQILYHYSKPSIEFKSYCSDVSEVADIGYNCVIVGPSLKNKISFGSDLVLSVFIQKYIKNYDANKNHSKFNFLRWLQNNNHENMIKNIKKKKLPDIGDSFMQAYAWFILKYI